MGNSLMVYHGKVGLFWGWRQHLYTHSVTLQDGDEDKHFINGQYDHVDFWPTLTRQYTALSPFAYHDIPRGRVIFVKGTQTYRTICSRELHEPHYRQLILDAFSLHDCPVEYMNDVHYTTDPEALNKLFEEDL